MDYQGTLCAEDHNSNFWFWFSAPIVQFGGVNPTPFILEQHTPGGFHSRDGEIVDE